MRLATCLALGFLAACSGYEGGGDVRIIDQARDSRSSAPAGPSGSNVPTEGALANGLLFQEPFEYEVESTHFYAVDTRGQLLYDTGHLGLSPRLTYADQGFRTATGTEVGLKPTDDFTVQVWGRMIAPPQSDYYGTATFDLVTKMDPQALVGWRLGFSASAAYAEVVVDGYRLYGIDLPGTYWSPGGGSSSLGPWHQLVLRYERGTLTLFADGESRDVSTALGGGIAPEANALAMGFMRNAFEGAAVGTRSVDSFALWRRALTDAEIALLYNGGRGRAL